MALFGMYTAVSALFSTIFGMGIETSGVRQVADANGKGDTIRIGLTVITLRRVMIVLGAAGAVCLLIFRAPISQLTFGDTTHTGALAILSLSIWLTAVSSGQMALIQGMRRIHDLANIKILGAISGLLVSVPLVWCFREQGIAPSMVAVAAALTLVSWRISRNVPIDQVKITWKETWIESNALLGLGLAFMVSGVLATGAAYIIRSFIVHRLGLDAAGHYQAAFALSGIYVGTITSAMAADFFPRLTAASQDNETCNRIVNEQSEIALLLAGPGIIATIALAPWVLSVLYSVEFLPAVEVLRWQILGDLGRIVSWPMGFIILAKGRGKLFIATETSTNLLHVVLVLGLTKKFGLGGTGIAFFVLYLSSCVMIRFVVGSISGFRWTINYLRTLTVYSTAVFVVFVATFLLDSLIASALGGAVALLSGVYSAHRVYHLIGPDYLSKKLAIFHVRIGEKLFKRK